MLVPNDRTKLKEVYHIESISEIHDIFGIAKPKHPLVSVIRYNEVDVDQAFVNTRCSLGMYYITHKNDTNGSIMYGRNSYDFQEGSMLFLKPGQVFAYDGHQSTDSDPGWALLFHPDLLRKSEFGKNIEKYTFFFL